MRKLLCMLLVMALILVAPLSNVAMAGAAPPISYLVLGDSLAAGTDNIGIQNAIKTILAKYPKITLLNYLFIMNEINQLQSNPNKYIKGNLYRYTYQFRDYLKSKNTAPMTLTDWSVPGYTSEQLLTQLKSLNTTNTNVLRNATYITIAIGGNDIMPAGDDYGFSFIDTAKLDARVATFKTNLTNTLNLIKQYNPNATIILMNLFNLYHPQEKSTDSKILYQQVDTYLKPGSATSNLGDWFMSLPAKYPNLKIADTYGLFDKVNRADMAQAISTADTYATKVGFINNPYKMSTMPAFPNRFVTGGNTTEVYSPFKAWPAYLSDYSRLTPNGLGNIVPANSGVAYDLYIHFYNPKNYVFGHDAATSEIYLQVKKQCSPTVWLLMKPNLDKFIGKYEKWRDVHCTELGHSLIARAHIDALK